MREWKSNHWTFWGWTWPMLSFGIVLCRAAEGPLMNRRRWHTFSFLLFFPGVFSGNLIERRAIHPLLFSPPIYPTYPLSPQLLPLTHTLSLFFRFFLSHAHPLRLSSYLIHERDSYGHIRTTQLHICLLHHIRRCLSIDIIVKCRYKLQSFLFLSCSFPVW